MDFPQNLFFHLTSETERGKKKKTGLVKSMGESFYFWILIYFQEMQNNKVQHNKSVQRVLWTFEHGVFLFFHYIIGYLNSKVLSQKLFQKRGI